MELISGRLLGKRSPGTTVEMGGLRISAAEPGDARSIARVHVLSWQFGHRGLFPDEVVESLAVEDREQAWRETLKGHSTGKVIFVAERGGEVVGFASAGPSRDPFPEPRAAEAYELFVHPETVGSGVGKALLRQCLFHLSTERFRAVTLWVVEGNERARGFYQRFGLQADGVTKFTEIGGTEGVEVRYRMSLD